MTKKLDKEHLEAITELQQNFSTVMRDLGSITIDLEFIETQKKEYSLLNFLVLLILFLI